MNYTDYAIPIKEDLEQEEGSQKFQALFDQAKSQGHSDGESALCTMSAAHIEMNRITELFHAEEITCEAFATAMHVQHWIHDLAAGVWNNSPESAAQGWRA
jgi:hypothetical protein